MTESDSSQITIEFPGLQWDLIKTRQPNNGSVYRSSDHDFYARKGEKLRITEEITYQMRLAQLGFPVPEIVAHGSLNDQAYYVEKSLGMKSYGQLFEEYYATTYTVSDEVFERYCNVANVFLKAQLQTVPESVEHPSLRTSLLIDEVMSATDIEGAALDAAFRKAIQNTRSLPAVYSHGDFGPYNTVGNGVIDFEDRLIAPVGYDVLTSPFLTRFFRRTSDKSELPLNYDFSSEQVQSYLDRIGDTASEEGCENLTVHLDDFLMLRAINLAAYALRKADRNDDHTIWENSKAILNACIQSYERNEKIDTSVF